MKKIILLLVASGIIICTTLIPGNNIYSNAAAPPPGYTNAPGDKNCTTSGCHDQATVRIDSTIEILSIGAYPLDNNNGYIPGQVYNLTLNGGNGFSVYGFELTAIDSTGNGIDSFSITDANAKYSTLSTLGSRQYLGHKNAGSNDAWAFNWTAPQTSGSIYLYVAYITADTTVPINDIAIFQKYKLTTSSFKLDTSTTDVTVVTAGIKSINADDAGISIFPNPVKDQLNLSFAAPLNQTVKADIYDLNGSIAMPLFETTGQGHTTRSFNIAGQLTTGIYIVKMSIGAKEYYKKIMVGE